jgi:hypothetical protein
MWRKREGGKEGRRAGGREEKRQHRAESVGGGPTGSKLGWKGPRRRMP